MNVDKSLNEVLLNTEKYKTDKFMAGKLRALTQGDEEGDMCEID